jgi:dTDP-4-amino-4,6-dideoxygalactose transaminase
MTVTVPATKIEMSLGEREAVMRVLQSGRLAQGPEVEAFEREFASLVNDRTCIAVNSGTSALHLALLGAGVGPGDEVIVPSFSFAATANAVVMAGATPIFADIDRATYCLDPDAAASAVNGRTAAIMPVHLYGHVADMSRFRDIANRHGLLLIEDAAQAHGASREGVPAGAWGDLAAFSFYATKNMTTGEGGMVVSADPDVSRRIRLLRNQGMERQYENEIAGLNNRMTDLAAAIGRVQLSGLAANNDRRRHVASRYTAELDGVEPPVVAPRAHHVYHQYTVRTRVRDRVLRDLNARGVEARIFYPIPIHRLPAYHTDDHLPETEAAAAQVLSLPVRPTLTKDEVDHVVQSVAAVTSGESSHA